MKMYIIRLAFFLGVFTIALILLAWAALARIEKQTLAVIGESLQTVLNTTEESLLLWQGHRKSIVSQKANNPVLIEATKRLLAISRDPYSLMNDQAQGDIRALNQIQFDRGAIVGIFIISPDSISLASMRDANIGTVNLIAEQRGDLLRRAFQGETVMVPPIQSDVPLPNFQGQMKAGFPTMFTMAPIIDAGDSIIAVLTIRYDPSEDFTRITQLGRIGQSGETYGFDNNGILITSSRFDEQLHELGIIQPGKSGITEIRIVDPGGNLLTGYQPEIKREEQPLTVMAKSAISGKRDFNITGYRDYRGVTVFGAWLWSDQMGFGLTTEIDKDEALLPYYHTRTAIIELVGVTVFLAVMLTFLGTLMRQRREREMVEYQRQLEGVVKERTSDLLTQNAKLENAIKEIKNLSGLLPICSHCKNIRDEKGNWNKLETYIDEHSEAEFSHGVCPVCAAEHYPGIKYTSS